jgi:hypothetical protein
MSLREDEQQRSRRAQHKHKKQLKLRIETKQEREERLEKAASERRQLRQRLAEDDDAVWTFKEWCALNGLRASRPPHPQERQRADRDPAHGKTHRYQPSQ